MSVPPLFLALNRHHDRVRMRRIIARDGYRGGCRVVAVDQELDLDRAPTRPTRVANLRAHENYPEFFGGPFRARTGDPLIKSQLLYQLS